jgi:hypothetical protein
LFAFILRQCLEWDWLIWLNPTLCKDRREKGEKRLIGQEKTLCRASSILRSSEKPESTKTCGDVRELFALSMCKKLQLQSEVGGRFKAIVGEMSPLHSLQWFLEHSTPLPGARAW